MPASRSLILLTPFALVGSFALGHIAGQQLAPAVDDTEGVVQSAPSATTDKDQTQEEPTSFTLIDDLAAGDPLPVCGPGDLPYVDLIGAAPIDQIQTVDALPGGNQLSDEEVAGLMRVMSTKGVLPVARNNIANRLVARRPLNPELWSHFAAMYDDPEEDPVWRDYSIQFLAVTIEGSGGVPASPAEAKSDSAGTASTGPDEEIPTSAASATDQTTATTDQAADAQPAWPSDAWTKLQEVARQDQGSIGATALLHCARLAEAGVVDRPADFTDLVTSRLTGEDTPALVLGTTLALAGQEKLTAALPLVRQHLRTPGSDDAKRGALYAISQLGDPATDLRLVESYLDDPNRSVVTAATAAQKRLQAARDATADESPAPAGQPGDPTSRLQNPSPTTPGTAEPQLGLAPASIHHPPLTRPSASTRGGPQA